MKQTELKGNSGEKTQLCTFWAADRLFGVNILDVREIIREVAYTAIPHAPKEVKGYVNIRGQVYLMLDLRTLLGFPSKEKDEQSRLVIFKSQVGNPFGVLVDKVGDIVAAESGSIEERAILDDSSLHQSEKRRDIILGECKLEGRLVILLKPASLLREIEKMN